MGLRCSPDGYAFSVSTCQKHNAKVVVRHRRSCRRQRPLSDQNLDQTARGKSGQGGRLRYICEEKRHAADFERFAKVLDLVEELAEPASH